MICCWHSISTLHALQVKLGCDVWWLFLQFKLLERRRKRKDAISVEQEERYGCGSNVSYLKCDILACVLHSALRDSNALFVIALFVASFQSSLDFF